MSRSSLSRRTYLKSAGVAGIAGFAGCSGSRSGADDGGTAGDTNKKEYSMTFATPYSLKSEEYVPIMQKAFKENVVSETDGRVTVDLAPGGELGVGSALAQKVQQGAIEAALFSLSNWSPFVPAVDLVNLPYFAGSNQAFVNLVRSEVWEEEVVSTVREKGYEPAYYVVVAPRAFATGPNVTEAPTTPAQVEEQGIKHRVPGSDILQKAWKMAGANPSPVDWGETPSALRQGVVDTVHVSPQFLAAFGFETLLNHLILVGAVEDAQTITMSRDWYTSLPSTLQDAVDRAAEKTQQQNFERIPQTRKNTYETFRDNGAEFVELSEAKETKWKQAMGYQRDAWHEKKKKLAGDMEAFEKFEQAVRTEADVTVPDGEL
ncbi:MAG: TRAP transporter substrate-binding protein [Haloferacaceae archaeon]